MAIGEGSFEEVQVGHRQSPVKPNCQNGSMILAGYFDHLPIRRRKIAGMLLTDRNNRPFSSDSQRISGKTCTEPLNPHLPAKSCSP